MGKAREELPARCPDVDVRVEHLAVTPDMIQERSLPTRPIKMSDTRAKAFAAKFGPISCELDAIPPNDLRALVGDAIAGHVDTEMIERMNAWKRRNVGHWPR